MSTKKRNTIDALRNIVNVSEQQLIRFQEYLESEEKNHFELKLRVQNMSKSFDSYQNAQTELELNFESDSNARILFEKEYYRSMGLAQELLAQTNPEQKFDRSPVHNHNTAEIKVTLPPMSVPTFSGNLSEWIPFHDMFVSLIHENKTLSDIQKFYYLHGSLKGSAAHVIQGLETTSLNYDIAWKLLKSRYHNENLIIDTHIKILFDLKPLGKAGTLRSLLDDFLKHIRALEALKQPVGSWDALLIHLLGSKLDIETYTEWRKAAPSDRLPLFKDMQEFLEHRSCVIESISNLKKVTVKLETYQPAQPKSYYVTSTSSSPSEINSAIKCPVCTESHLIFQCPQFLKMSITERINTVNSLKLCYNCLRHGHHSSICRSKSCKFCNKRHNSLLHTEENTRPTSPLNSVTHNHNQTQNYFIKENHQSSPLLTTVLVDIISPDNGATLTARALLDSGSQSCFITENMCNKLGLKRRILDSITISGIGLCQSNPNHSATATIKSRRSDFTVNSDFYVLKKITEKLPTTSFSATHWNIPNNVQLADPAFNLSTDVDLLLGVDVFWDSILTREIKLAGGRCSLRESKLGWIPVGSVDKNTTAHLACITPPKPTNTSLSQQLEKFWNIEEQHEPKRFSGEDCECERRFAESTIRAPTGRYTISLPFKSNPPPLGDSREKALRRFYSLERRLSRDTNLHTDYSKFMNEYIALGHMTPIDIPENELPNAPYYFIPHHPVIKESTTTKLRVVFDASAKTSSGFSLNDSLMAGPTIQDDLVSIIIRFRTHKYAMIADIEKMFRQIEVDHSQRHFQLIFWREKKDQPLQTFMLNTVTYGTTPASYLATKTLHKLAEDEKHRFPLASACTKADFYMDDVLTGSNSLSDAKKLQGELIFMLKSGGFNLRKWSSNDPALLMNPTFDSYSQTLFDFDHDKSVKTLGLIWNPSRDTFSYSIRVESQINTHITKRSILSATAKIFDPLGLLGPVIFKAKLLIQKLWKLGLDWDELVPVEISEEWISFHQQIPSLSNLMILRQIVGPNAHKTELHGFSDASESGYGACLYLKTIDKYNGITVNLIASKSRVAPLKKTTLPRLELCGALLLSILTNKTVKALNINISKTYLWTDSTIVLSWLFSESSHWATFVANRVAEIQELTSIASWHHVQGKDNPADHVSRGLSPEDIVTNSLWWQGPSWLTTELPSSLLVPFNSDLQNIPERRTKLILTTTISTQPDIIFNQIHRYSSSKKIIRILAYCLRFGFNSKTCNKNQRKTGPLSVSEREISVNVILKAIQKRSFSQELSDLTNDRNLNKKSPLLSLTPFIDQKGLLRVGGRLKNAEISPDHKHPIVLPKGDRFSSLLAREMHLDNIHCGSQTLLHLMRQIYWPIHGRSMTRNVVSHCVPCFKARPKISSQLMGNLPAPRVNQSRAFLHTGVDYCGPFQVKPFKGSRSSSLKCYVSLFICMSTKAIHLELAEDLSTASFLNCYRCFVSRRGIPSDIYSDNGTNFVGANRQLQQLIDSKEHQSRLIETTPSHWHFIPPQAPHFGGLWESGVKLVKSHMKSVVGNQTLTIFQFHTLLTLIEGTLNSRLITPMSNDPNDPSALSPSHFLILDNLKNLPEPDLQLIPTNRLNHWQKVQQMHQMFWKRWSVDYLNNLQQRSKWRQNSKNLNIGDLVLIKEDGSPPTGWHMGRITELHPGNDGNIRVVTLKTINGYFKRSINKLCPLPVC